MRVVVIVAVVMIVLVMVACMLCAFWPCSSTMNLVADTPARSTRVAETAAPSMRKAAERAPQLFERQAGVEQRAQHHVARRAVEAVEIQNPGHSFLAPLLSALYLSGSELIVYLLRGS